MFTTMFAVCAPKAIERDHLSGQFSLAFENCSKTEDEAVKLGDRSVQSGDLGGGGARSRR